MDWQALGLSLRLSACTAVLLATFGLPAAWWLATTRRRWRVYLEAIVALPLVLPPTVLGFYVLLALGPHSPLGRAAQFLTGQILPFTFPGLLFASLLYSMPFAWQPLIVAFRGLDRSLMEAAQAAGATPARAIWRVAIPLAWPGLLSGIILSFAHTLGEFGVVLMVGGNIPGVTRTISISIYDQVESLDYRRAMVSSVLLLVISFTVLTVTYTLQRGFRFVGGNQD
jgi:molybdate transport system permease protein